MIEPASQNPHPPSPTRRWFDQQVVPLLIDLAGGVEQGLERLAVQVRKSPVLSLGIATATGALLSVLLKRRPGPLSSI